MIARDAALPFDHSGSAAQLAAALRHLAAAAAMVLMLSTLVIDGFPAGIAILREFGARPVNFLLAVALAAMFVRDALSGEVLVSRKAALLLATVFLLIPGVNLPVALVRTTAGLGEALGDWAKQFLMLGWGLISWFVWRRLLKRFDERELAKLVCVAAVPALLAFLLEYLVDSSAVLALLDLFRLKWDDRPSGLATEPSLYGAWTVVVWPLLAFATGASRSYLGKLGAATVLALVLVTAYLSNARTAAVILVLQLGYYGYWVVRRDSGLRQRLRSLLIMGALGLLALAVLTQRLLTLGDVEENASNVARFGYVLAGINVVLEHPLTGIGVGQFKYFFGAHVPEFALVSEEIALYATQTAEFRTSTFNLFVRLFCEFGALAGVALSALLLRPLLAAPRAGGIDDFRLCAALSAVGGVGFWLTQDQYGYQPAIFALALLANRLSAETS